MIKLKNLLKNSNCEEFEYDIDGSIKLKYWKDIKSTTPEARISTEHTFLGMYSIEVIKDYVLRYNLSEAFITLIKDHIYALIWRVGDINNNWTTKCNIFEVEDESINELVFPAITEEKQFIDSVILIDLTESFTNEGIPTSDFLITLPYFSDEYNITNEKKTKILNIDDFTYNIENKCYYNKNNEVTFKFSIENFNESYNNNNTKYGTRIILSESYKEENYNIEDYEGTNRKITELIYGEEGFNHNNIIHKDIKNNITYFEVTLTCDENSISRQIQIIGDGHLNGNKMVTYIGFNWRNPNQFNILNVNISNNAISDSPYMRLIKGETNPYLLAPTNIKVYINNNLTSDVFITKKTKYENMEFEKQVFLNDGENIITVKSFDIFGDCINEYKETITVRQSTSIIPKADLLTNFIGEDDQMIELAMDNVDLRYEDKNAGLSKIVNIDQTITSHFFNLEGIHSEYYRIDRKTLPVIRGDILRRPINILFNGVEKVYDGDFNISLPLRALQYNDGYSFNTIHNSDLSYSNTGFVKGSFEILYANNTIFKQNDIVGPIIKNKDTNLQYFDYFINSNDVKFNSFEITIDNDEGYTLDNGEIIMSSISKKEQQLEHAKIEKSEILNMVTNKDKVGLYYSIYTSTLGKNEKLYGIAYNGYRNISGDIEVETYELMDNDINNTENMKIALENWLKSIDHKIYKLYLQNDKDGNTHLIFLYNKDVTEYSVKSNITIKYKYKNNLNSNIHVFRDSDENKVYATFDSAYLNSKYTSTEWKPIIIKDLKLTSGTLGDESKNYIISGYSAYGRIVPRGVIPHITCLNKVYDGTSYVPFSLDNSNDNYNGLENSIINDDVYIDDTYHGVYDSNFHQFKKIGSSYLQFENEDVGENKQVNPNPHLVLEGYDANNYYIKAINCNFIASIYKRRIEIVFDLLRYITTYNTWEVKYHFINHVPNDILTIAINNDEFAFKVYGGTYTGDNSFNLVDRLDLIEDNINDVKTMYLNSFNNNTKSPKLVSFESNDKQYKLKDGDTVLISGITLDPKNNKSKNYELINTTFKTKIEII